MAVTRPWSRIMGGIPVVMWRSEAPLATNSFSNSWRFGIGPVPFSGVRVSPAAAAGPFPGPSPLRPAGHPHDFLDGGGPLADLLQAGLPQGLHPVRPGQFPELRGGPPLEDGVLDLPGDDHHPLGGHAPFVAGLAAGHAPLPLEGLDALGLLGGA